MIDKIQRVAVSVQFFRLPAIGLGLAALVAIGVILLLADSPRAEAFLIPSVVALIWSLSAHSFIVTFRSVPERADRSQGWFRRLWRNLVRGWYWLIALLFLATTLAAVYFTYRVISIWMRDFG